MWKVEICILSGWQHFGSIRITLKAIHFSFKAVYLMESVASMQCSTFDCEAHFLKTGNTRKKKVHRKIKCRKTTCVSTSRFLKSLTCYFSASQSCCLDLDRVLCCFFHLHFSAFNRRVVTASKSVNPV